MNKMRIGWGLAFVILGVAFVGTPSAAAQSYLMPDTPERGVWLEVTHPNTKLLEVTAPSTAWFLSGRLPVMERVRVVADLPFAYGKPDLRGAPRKGNTVLGNPYLGAEYVASDRVMLEAGIRAPLTTADEDSFGDVVGFLADPLRGEAFLMDVVPISGAVKVRHAFAAGPSVRVHGGFTSAIYTGDEDDFETVNFLDYGIFGTHTVRMARLGAGVSGRWDASADMGDFSDNSLHQLGLSADARFRGVRPGIAVRVPLDESQREIVGSTVGLYLQVPLR